MHTELANLNHSTVPILSRAAANLCWYNSTTTCYNIHIKCTLHYILYIVLQYKGRYKKTDKLSGVVPEVHFVGGIPAPTIEHIIHDFVILQLTLCKAVT